MKKYLSLFVFLAFASITHVADASVLYSESISLAPGWNIISTPKVLESHSFSLPETSENFDIYALNASGQTGWSTLADLGQTEFTPLFSYFVNNKSASAQTLTLNYKAGTTPSERLFNREFSKSGWYSIGVANPTYVKGITANISDTNNPSRILNLLSGNYDSVIDLTDEDYSSNPSSVRVTNVWKQAVVGEINNLNDLRENKGYVIYITNPTAHYSGFQNENIPVISTSTLTLSTNSGTPVAGDVIVNSGSLSNEADKVAILLFDVKAENNNIKITDIVASTTVSGLANLTNAYLYDGGTLIASAAVVDGSVVFNDIDYTVWQDSTKTLTLKADVRNAADTVTAITATVSSSGITAEDSAGSDVVASGSATSNTLDVKKAGPLFTLVSKSTSKSVTTNTNTATATAILDAAFTVNLSARGAPVIIGQVGSSTSFATSSSFTIYKNGVDLGTTTLSAPIVVDYSNPSSGVTVDNINKVIIVADGNSANITVHAKITVTGSATSDGYSVQLKKLFWNGTFTNSMDGQSAWRTDAIVLP